MRQGSAGSLLLLVQLPHLAQGLIQFRPGLGQLFLELVRVNLGGQSLGANLPQGCLSPGSRP